MPSRLVDDPKHWRDRATGMRALLDAITDLDTKSRALRLADDYDTLADRAEDRTKTSAPAPSPMRE
jgi:predicted dienelactone hydrolase